MEAWANMIAVLKTGDKKTPVGYRTVSALSLFGNVFEKLASEDLLLHELSILSEAQHSLLPRCSYEQT